MKTYFKYEGIIKSKEAAEAIAAPSGLGPFCGFGSATIMVINWLFLLREFPVVNLLM